MDEFDKLFEELLRLREKRIEKSAMARGSLIVDENHQELAAALKARNIHIVIPHPGQDDDEIKRQLLTNRIIVTANPKDFVLDASSYDYGIIAINKLKFIDKSPNANNKTAKMISQAIIKHDLWSKRHGFILVLHEDGNHQYLDLTD